MKQNHQHQHQNGVVLPQFSSFACDWEQDEPFYEEDLRAIEATESRFYNNTKRPFSDSSAAKGDGGDVTSDNSVRRSNRRRCLRRSLVALKHPNASSLSPWSLPRLHKG
ncbi:hypothetical protein PIB30_088258 [Stylosanthes scabra]|uniref:Uncharacterized protein n=1 Tax=Stylosanthes scabra TaxID=79078 RepID=A0ABU6XRA1_9FABA|nr:hypothetical protein [Stylosanthes scabra]